MLLAVVAACSSETIEVPGETVVVEKEVVKEVMVPGETVTVEVIKEVEVPGETVVVEKEVVKTVEVPGETVVVEKEVVKTVEVPGETVTKEVVKEVMVPGETVVVEKEVVKEVMVPGETVVVEKEVVKTVEVPGETVVVEKEVVKEVVKTVEVPGKKYVTDPSTGKTVSAPQYGGTLTAVRNSPVTGADVLITGNGVNLADTVVETLGMADWASPRDEFSLQARYDPQNYAKGSLAESWSQPDPLTYIVKVRQGVKWHDKAPMNGRELTAQDVEYNFHRVLGLGSGFTEPNDFVTFDNWSGVNVESITATDKYTVVFKLKELNLRALAAILDDGTGFIYPPEVIEEHGDANDWRNLVGTGPMMLTDVVEDSSVTWIKNADYWGYDEKYPENRLPYIDQLRVLVITEPATRMAALRSGKIDYLGFIGTSPIQNLEQVESLLKTNPELGIWSAADAGHNSVGMNVQLPPFDDIRVRKALQMAINLEVINNAYYKGYAEIIPQGQLSRQSSQAVIQFEDWPEEVKKVFDYDPEGAEALLDAAGYKRGADGVRFKTDFMHLGRYNTDYVELVAAYWKNIGVDVEIDVQLANFGGRRASRDFRMMITDAQGKVSALGWAAGMRYLPETHWNTSNVDDPWYNAKYNEKAAATTMEEVNSITKELNQYAIEQFWTLFGPIAPTYAATQPWLIGYNGEITMGRIRPISILIRLWLDSELKEAKGY